MEIGLTPSSVKVPTKEQREAFKAQQLSRPAGPEDAEFQLLYWPFLIGRGEVVRLMFVEAGVEWHEPALVDGKVDEIIAHMQGSVSGFRAFAPPILRKGEFILSQTSTILQYLGKKFGYDYDNDELAAQVNCVCETALDFLGQGRLAFHVDPVPNKSYYDQVEQARPFVEHLRNERLPRFLKYLDDVLARNKKTQNNPQELFVVGDKMTYADIAVLHFTMACQSQCPEAFQACDVPELKSHMERLQTRENINKYLVSSRRGDFEGNSFM